MTLGKDQAIFRLHPGELEMNEDFSAGERTPDMPCVRRVIHPQHAFLDRVESFIQNIDVRHPALLRALLNAESEIPAPQTRSDASDAAAPVAYEAGAYTISTI